MLWYKTLFANSARTTDGHRPTLNFPVSFDNHSHNSLAVGVLLSDTSPLISARLQESEPGVGGRRNMVVTFYAVIANHEGRTSFLISQLKSYETTTTFLAVDAEEREDIPAQMFAPAAVSQGEAGGPDKACESEDLRGSYS